MITFALRNWKLYFKNRSTVLFSLMASLIVLALYVMFLGDIWASNLGGIPNAREIMDNWVMAGMLGITSLTTTTGFLHRMITDKESNIIMDFYVAPIKRWQLVGGYLLSAVVLGLVMTLIVYCLAQFYIGINGGAIISGTSLLVILGVSALATAMNTALAMVMVSLFNSQNSFSIANSIVGTLIGFVTGIYLPIGMFPGFFQSIIKVFPVSHACVLFRQIMMENVLERSFSSQPAAALTAVKAQLGVTFTWGDHMFTFFESGLYMVAVTIIGAALAYVIMNQTKR